MGHQRCCDERRDLKQVEKKNTGKQTRIQKAVKRSKKDWIDTQCEEIKI